MLRLGCEYEWIRLKIGIGYRGTRAPLSNRSFFKAAFLAAFYQQFLFSFVLQFQFLLSIFPSSSYFL